MLDRYISCITYAWFDKNDLPPEDISLYAPYIEKIRTAARRKNDVEYLCLAFEHLLANPHINEDFLKKFSGSRFLYEPKDIMEIINYAYKTLWPEKPVPQVGHYPDIQFIDTGWDIREWWKQREELNSQVPVKYIDEQL